MIRNKRLIPTEDLAQLGKRKSVRIALIKEHDQEPQILLTTEQKGIIYNSLPGGKVDLDEYENNTSVENVLISALARELEEELGLPRKQFLENVLNLVEYFYFATLTKFNAENPLTEVVFYSLISDEVLEKLDFGKDTDAKIIGYNWVPLKEVLGNFEIDDQNILVPEGTFIFIDNHIPEILEKLNKKFSKK